MNLDRNCFLYPPLCPIPDPLQNRGTDQVTHNTPFLHTRIRHILYLALMITRRTFGKITWVDALRPTESDLEDLRHEFGVQEIVTNELGKPTFRPRVDIFKNYIYLILHFPVIHHKPNQPELWEIDFIVGKNFLITAHYHETDTWPTLVSYIEELYSEKSRDIVHGGFLLYYIASYLYRSLDMRINEIEQSLDIAEEGIFKNSQFKMVEYLSYINHDILDFKKAVSPHQEILSSFESAGKQFFGEKFTHYLSALAGEYSKIATRIASSKESLRDLQQINDSLLNTKTNHVIKSLTIMAFITFPLTLMAAIFGMNTSNTPFIGHPYDFWIVVGIMFVGVLGMIALFRYKKWL